MLLTRERSFYKRFFSMLLFLALQNAIVFGVNLADNIMIGAYSEAALSGVALANQIQFLLQMLTNGVGEGVVVLASQYWGQKKTEPIKHIASVGLIFGLVLALAMWAVVFFAPEWCLGLLIDDAAVIAEGVSYIKIVCFSYFFFVLSQVLLSVLRSVETVRIGFIVSCVTLVMNIGLNYVLIFGEFGFPELGAAGAAIATLASRVAECVIIIIYTRFIDKKLRMRVIELIKADFSYLRDYIRSALPVIASGGSWGLAMLIQTAILGHMGAASVAANSIATTLFSILTVITYGSSSVGGVIIGKTVGTGDIPKVKEYARTLQMMFLVIGVLTGVSLFLLRDVIVSLYSVTPETAELARQFITVLSITVVGTSYQAPCLTGIVRGGGDTKFVFYNDLIFMWGIVLPSSWLAAFVFGFSPVVVFACLKADQILKCAVAVVKVNRFKFIRTLTRSSAK